FQNAQTLFQGNGISYSVVNRPAGTYYYRVNATVNGVTSAWSIIVNTLVKSTTPPPPPPSPTGAIVEGYWESWNSNTPLTTIAAMHCDVFNISFMTFTRTGSHTFALTGLDTDLATMDQFIQIVHSAGKQVKLALGGATYGFETL